MNPSLTPLIDPFPPLSELFIPSPGDGGVAVVDGVGEGRAAEVVHAVHRRTRARLQKQTPDVRHSQGRRIGEESGWEALSYCRGVRLGPTLMLPCSRRERGTDFREGEYEVKVLSSLSPSSLPSSSSSSSSSSSLPPHLTVSQSPDTAPAISTVYPCRRNRLFLVRGLPHAV
jgi:hypothetical protein